MHEQLAATLYMVCYRHRHQIFAKLLRQIAAPNGSWGSICAKNVLHIFFELLFCAEDLSKIHLAYTRTFSYNTIFYSIKDLLEFVGVADV